MIVQILRFVCDICDRRHEDQAEVAFGMATSSPIVPGGWTQVGRQLVCPNHQVVIDPRPAGI